MQQIIYSGSDEDRAHLVQTIPELKLLLGINEKGQLSAEGGFHAGFASELMGKVHPAHLGRLYGPDVWLVRSPGAPESQTPKLVIGEENGGNPGGADRLRRLTHIFQRGSEYGEPPNNNRFHKRMLDHVKDIFKKFKPEEQRKPVIVYYTEDSLTKGPVEVKFEGKTETIMAYNPKPPELIEDLREEFARNGTIWLSAVDPKDKERIFVLNGELFVIDRKNGSEQVKKVDVLYTRLDVEMADSTYQPQVERNKMAHREDMTQTGKLIGIPGLVEAWLQGQNPDDPSKRGFVWVNGLTSMLTTNKIWPAFVDMYIKRVMKQEVKIPLLTTETFFTSEGEFDREKFEKVWRISDDYVAKMTLGQGGKQVEFPHDMIEEDKEALKEKMIKALEANAFSYILQARADLNRVAVDYNGYLQTPAKLFHDFRLVSFISPFGVTKMKQLLIRLSQFLKINVSQGGSMALGARSTEVEKVQPVQARSLPPRYYMCFANFLPL